MTNELTTIGLEDLGAASCAITVADIPEPTHPALHLATTPRTTPCERDGYSGIKDQANIIKERKTNQQAGTRIWERKTTNHLDIDSQLEPTIFGLEIQRLVH